MSPSPNAHDHRSRIRVKSTAIEGVVFEIRRVSLTGRAELTAMIRGLLSELEFQEAGDELASKLRAAELRARIDEAYLRWGLTGLSGIQIDGEQASVERLIECGPEGLCREIAAAIRRECTLSEAERKN